MQQPNQDPHGYITEGTRQMWAYLYRQFWSMKVVTIVLVGLMCTYSYISQQWIPFMGANLISMLIWFMAWWMGINTLKKLFVGAVQMQRTQNNDLPKVYSAIGNVMWMQYALSIIGSYWAIMLLLAAYVMEGT